MTEKKKVGEIVKRLADMAEGRKRAQISVRKDKRSTEMKRLRTDGAGAGDIVHTHGAGLSGGMVGDTLWFGGGGGGVFSSMSLQPIFDALNHIGSPAGNEALSVLRRVMCSPNAPIQEIIDAGVVPRLILALRSEDESVRSDSVWCLTNIATGNHDQTAQVLQAAPDLLNLLASENMALQEQACWAIGNIAGDSDEFRATLIANGALQPILSFLVSSTVNLLGSVGAACNTSPNACGRTAAWAISNLSRGSTSSLNFVSSGAIPMLISLTAHTDQVIVTEMWWLFYYLSGKENEAVECMLQHGMAEAITLSITKANPADITTIPLVRTLGNITSGCVEWTSKLLSCPALLPAIAVLLSPSVSHKGVLKEALWIMSNLFGSPKAEHRTCALRAGLLNQVFLSLLSDQCDLQRDAIFALRNACVDGDAIQLVLLHGGKPVVQQIVCLLRIHDSDIVLACIQVLRALALESPLQAKSQVIETYNKLDLYDVLEVLQFGSNPSEVRQAAICLISDVFETEEEFDITPQETGGLQDSSSTLTGMGRGRHLSKPSWMQHE